MRPTVRDFVANAAPAPSAALSLERYRQLATGYDGTARYAERIRIAAVDALGLRRGEVVLDVACGSGLSLPHLAQRVGATGRVVGVDHCPAMIEHARARVAQASLMQVRLINAPIETVQLEPEFDALLFCYTHDVLQSREALGNLIRCARPGARVAIAGLRLLPWLWAAPINLWNLYRTSCYLTTFAGLREPWLPLLGYCPNLTIVRTFWCGSHYVAAGVVTPRRA